MGSGVINSSPLPFKNDAKTGTTRGIGNARDKGFILSRKFTSLAPEPLSGAVSTPKCCSWMFSPLSGTRTRDFDP